ncbi:hypothetical protein LJR235_002285 [Pararhizobium sp. LjRoot235]|uniref:hypothetical protein n=1 Tax=Pararhizobium sp. LjRoot235 TaxID=3342291 RepID=UPI003ECD65EA
MKLAYTPASAKGTPATVVTFVKNAQDLRKRSLKATPMFYVPQKFLSLTFQNAGTRSHAKAICDWWNETSNYQQPAMHFAVYENVNDHLMQNVWAGDPTLTTRRSIVENQSSAFAGLSIFEFRTHRQTCDNRGRN